MTASASWRVAGRCPAVGSRIISPADLDVLTRVGVATPDDHLTSAVDSGVGGSRSRCVGSAGGGPNIRVGIVSSAGVESDEAFILTAPHNHFAASPNGGVP